jgi:alpha-glucoside transport system permease protein
MKPGNLGKVNRFFNKIPLHLITVFLLIIWILPTLGLLITSFRPVSLINTSGWWTALSPKFSDTQRFTINNYVDALVGYRGQNTYLEDCASGNQSIGMKCNISDLLNSRGMGRAFLNSLAVTIPATIFPLMIAAFAGYAFAWMDFKGRYFLFAILVGLQVVPLQMTLVPILRIYAQLGLNGTFWGVWLFHTGFGLPYAIYLMRNFLGNLPKDLFESAYLDGASHWSAFWKLAIPLSTPALASLAIFQFLWVWNDLLVALVFLGGTKPVMTYQISNMVTSLGAGWHLLTAAAFLSMLLPMIIFFALQRFFVRGMMAGAVKG